MVKSARAGEVCCNEDEGRRWRYGVLKEMALCGGYSDVVTGHTMSDRAETLLGNLMNGAGGGGLGAMGWIRELGEGVKLVRPMLEIGRWETGEFCRDMGLEVWEDLYNEKWEYRRNRIRKDVVPYLKRWFNPQVEEALAKTAEILKEEEVFMESKVDELWRDCVVDDVTDDESLHIDRRLLCQAPIALQRRLLKRVVNRVGGLGHTAMFKQVEALSTLIHAEEGASIPSLPLGQSAYVSGHLIKINRPLYKRQLAV